MAVFTREFEQMVADTLMRIANTTNITNMNSGSVIRTITESILAETDVQNYQITQLFTAMDINNAIGDDLDRLVAILGVVRKPSTPAPAILTFSRTTPHTSDIPIVIGNIVSTLPDRNGMTVEFYVSEEAVLLTGELSVDVEATAVIPGSIYIPENSLVIMNAPIINIESVTNSDAIFGGTDTESDDELRVRAKEALTLLGKGTVGAIETAIRNIPGVIDAIVIDMPRGVGTVDAIVVTGTIPPPTELYNQIAFVVSETKAAGIMVDVIYPTILAVDVTVNTIRFSDATVIYDAIIEYFQTLKISDEFIINQMERAVLNASGVADMDIVTVLPTTNINPSGTEIIRAGVVTINGVVQ